MLHCATQCTVLCVLLLFFALPHPVGLLSLSLAHHPTTHPHLPYPHHCLAQDGSVMLYDNRMSGDRATVRTWAAVAGSTAPVYSLACGVPVEGVCETLIATSATGAVQLWPGEPSRCVTLCCARVSSHGGIP